MNADGVRARGVAAQATKESFHLVRSLYTYNNNNNLLWTNEGRRKK